MFRHIQNARTVSPNYKLMHYQPKTLPANQQMVVINHKTHTLKARIINKLAAI